MSERITNQEEPATLHVNELSDEQLQTISSRAHDIRESDSETLTLDMRSMVNEEVAFKTGYNMTNAEVTSFVTDAEALYTEKKAEAEKAELCAVVEAADTSESMADLRTKLSGLEGFRKVYDMNNLELKAFVESTRARLATLEADDDEETSTEVSEPEQNPEVTGAEDDMMKNARAVIDGLNAASPETRAAMLPLLEKIKAQLDDPSLIEVNPAIGASEAGEEAELVAVRGPLNTQEVDDESDKTGKPRLSLADRIEASRAERTIRAQRAIDRADLVAVNDPINAPDIDTKTPEEEAAPSITSKWRNVLGGLRERATDMSLRAVEKVRNFKADRKSNSGETRDADESKERTGKKRVALLVGGFAVAVAGVYLARRYDIDIMPSALDGDGIDMNPSNNGGESTEIVSGVDGNVSGGETPLPDEAMSFSDAAVDIDRGEGWYQTFNEMGIPQGDRASILQEVGPKLEQLGAAYYDSGASEYRMELGNGQLSNEALTLIANAAKARGIAIS